MKRIWSALKFWHGARYLEGQLRRIGVMMFPFGWIEPIWAIVVDEPYEADLLPGMFTWGIATSGACLLGLPFVRHKLLLAVLALSGFCWALPMQPLGRLP